MVEIRTSWMMELAALTKILWLYEEHPGYLYFSDKQVGEMRHQHAELSNRLFGAA